MLQGKRALITGSTSGIGLGMAHKLASQGCSIVLNGFGEAQAIERLRTDLASEYKVDVRFEGGDLTRPAEIEHLAQRCIASGGIDILINNAGIQHVAPLETFAPERWDAVIALNLSAAFHTTRLLLPGMRARNWGRIINIASAHGLVASVEKAAYVAAKHGIIGLTKVTALETARTGITANAICPGWVLTPLVQKQIDDRARAQGIPVEQAAAALLGDKQPSLQFTTPDQLGALAVFLCSDAAINVRGAAWNMDGGWVAQ
jgi:3-hydroxybutyrate dehydrogenase